MRFSSVILAIALSSHTVNTNAFNLPSPTFKRVGSKLLAKGEFDFLLGEGDKFAISDEALGGKINRRTIVQVPDSSHAATLTSSVTYDEVASAADDLGEEDVFGEGAVNQISDEVRGDPRLDELIRKKEDQIAMKSQPTERKSIGETAANFVKGKDFGELFFTVAIPVIAGYYFFKKAAGKASENLEEKADELLTNYANEMIYHDGDFDEMKLAHADYSKKMAWMGPNKSDRMIKCYLEQYAKMKVISPQAISSLSYIFSMYKLSEDRAAEILSELCITIEEKIASVGKLYFIGNHILKTKEAKAKLEPIFKSLSNANADFGMGVSGDEIVRKSQIAMGEAAYKSAVAAGGKNQAEMTIGWEVLGLDKETATVIFNEVAHGGFVSDREAKYGIASQKFDDKGRKVQDDGELVNPEEATDDDDEENLTSSGNVQECSECGYTLFVAEGRDFKFFGAGFKCPECGASKDKFVGKHMDA